MKGERVSNITDYDDRRAPATKIPLRSRLVDGALIDSKGVMRAIIDGALWKVSGPTKPFPEYSGRPRIFGKLPIMFLVAVERTITSAPRLKGERPKVMQSVYLPVRELEDGRTWINPAKGQRKKG